MQTWQFDERLLRSVSQILNSWVNCSNKLLDAKELIALGIGVGDGGARVTGSARMFDVFIVYWLRVSDQRRCLAWNAAGMVATGTRTH